MYWDVKEVEKEKYVVGDAFVLDTIQDFLCELGIKPRMQLSLHHVIVRPTKIIRDLCKANT